MKVLVIGGDAAGLKAAARLRRLEPEARITVLEKSQIISYAACGMPYFLSGDIDSFRELRETAWGDFKDPDFFREAKDIDVRLETEAVSIDRSGKYVRAMNHREGTVSEFEYDYLVLATGSEPLHPDIPGCDLAGVSCFTRPEEAKALREELQTGRIGKVVIVGAGYIGLELCEAFGALWGAEVVLLEKEDHVLPRMLDREMSIPLENHLREQDVELRTGVSIKRIDSSSEGLHILLESGESFGCDRLIFAAGVRPRIEPAASAGLEIGSHGGVLVDRSGRTSDPSIFAAGDCAELPYRDGSRLLPLGSVANRLGRVVANVIAGREDTIPDLYGTAVVKVFDKNVAVCGKTAAALRGEGISAEEYWGGFTDRAHYYPENKDVHIKVVREKEGRLAGVQVIGGGEVVRWANAFAQVLDLAGGDPRALFRVEHAYAPPFATAMDPLHHIGAMIEAGPDLQLPPDALYDGGRPEWTVVSLLSEEEATEWNRPEIKGKWLDISYRELRERFDEIPRDNVILLCARGPRSYEAARFLRSRGIAAKYIAGGITFH